MISPFKHCFNVTGIKIIYLFEILNSYGDGNRILEEYSEIIKESKIKYAVEFGLPYKVREIFERIPFEIIREFALLRKV